jgi:hypothetical protein
MILSHVLLRWYRSFNTLSTDRAQNDPFAKAAWNTIEKGKRSVEHISALVN